METAGREEAKQNGKTSKKPQVQNGWRNPTVELSRGILERHIFRDRSNNAVYGNDDESNVTDKNKKLAGILST